ncbi:hypothetical protein BJ912DRAFT_881144 [Pholiota molesta]|nr:hypothetical protein BJ912DRAFT_881144 [Pholiota molesta]
MAFVSPFMNVLGTNYAPAPIDIDAIERTLEAPSANLRALECQLIQLQEQLETKRERRDTLSRSIDEHYNLLTPFRCLPDDILREIFVACLPTEHESMMDCNEPPLVLGYVCTSWRSVTYGTPRLWATLHISIPRPPSYRGPVKAEPINYYNDIFEGNVNRHLIRIDTWLSRSKACPLAITIHDPYSYWPVVAPTMAYYQLLNKFSDRIWRLDLDGISHQPTSDFLASIPSTSFPHLRVLLLKFNQSRHGQFPTGKWRDSGLLNVPSLTCLRVSICPFRLDDITVNWTHLTHLIMAGASLRRLDISDAQKIFTRCPRLRHCAIDFLSLQSPPVTYTPFSLPYLHTLAIVDSSFYLGDLFEYAELPSLRDLSYHSKLCPALDRPSAMFVILSRTNASVERLTTNIQFFTLADLLKCFEMTPSLTHLTNIRCASGFSSNQRRLRQSLPVAPKMLTALLDVLTPAPHRPLYLPDLQVVDFDSTNLQMQLSDFEIVNFIRSRMDGAARTSNRIQVAALTKVSFVLSNDMENDIRPQLSDYIANGMKLHLTYLGNPSPSRRARGFSSNTYVVPDSPLREVDDVDYL